MRNNREENEKRENKYSLKADHKALGGSEVCFLTHFSSDRLLRSSVEIRQSSVEVGSVLINSPSKIFQCRGGVYKNKHSSI